MEDESAIPVLEDEAIQFECLLVEPQDDHVSVDAFLCFHRNSPEKCMEMEDIPCKFGIAWKLVALLDYSLVTAIYLLF